MNPILAPFIKLACYLQLTLVNQNERRDIHLAKSQILAIDAGGTMTDTFIIDEKGEFVVGKHKQHLMMNISV